MKLLLTDAGVTNPSIRNALTGLLGKPIEESKALCIPTAAYGHPWVEPQKVWEFVSGNSSNPMCGLGWQSVGVLELTALPSIGDDRWVEWVRGADVLLAGGGDALFLAHWMRESGLAELLPSLTEQVWLGMSAGSMALTPRIGRDFMQWQSPTGDDRALGVVDFAIFPHLGMPENTMEAAEKWAAEVAVPAYVTDNDTAIKVVDGVAEVVSEGTWRRLNA